jgi:hypothetical protein
MSASEIGEVSVFPVPSRVLGVFQFHAAYDQAAPAVTM